MVCEASYEIKHNMDEDYYPVGYCPFCGEENEEDDYYEEDEEQ